MLLFKFCSSYADQVSQFIMYIHVLFVFFVSIELQLSLREAQLTKNNEIQLTLELSGYEGETSAEVTVDVNIAESLYHGECCVCEYV